MVRMRSARLWGLVVATAVTATEIGCAKPPPAQTAAAAKAAAPTAPPAAPPPLTLIPADLVRHWLTASVTIPALERSLPAAVALASRATPLPLDAGGVKAMLLSQTGLPPDVALNLDLDAPLAAALVGREPGRPPATAYVFAGKDVAGASAMLAALGEVQARRGAAIQIRSPRGETAWFMQVGKQVVFSDSDDTLARAGSLALEAHRKTGDDVTITVFPDALARASGVDVKTAVQRWRDQVIGAAGEMGHSISPEAQDALGQIALYAADIARAEIGVKLDAGSGASLLARLVARPSSALETLSRQVQPAAIDPRLLSRPDASFAVASAYGSEMRAQLRRQASRLTPAAGQQGGKEVLAALDLLTSLEQSITGENSAAGVLRPVLAGEGVYLIKDAAGAKRLRAALDRADKGAVAVLWSTAFPATGGSRDSVVAVRRETVGRTRVLRGTFKVPQATGSLQLLRKLFGADTFDIRAAVIDDQRFAIAVGKDGRRRLGEIAAGKTGTAAPPLADAIKTSAARSFFFYADLADLFAFGRATGQSSSRGGQNGKPSAARVGGAAGSNTGGDRVPMAVFGGARGDMAGSALVVDLTLTPACFVGFGALMQGALIRRP